MGIIFPFYRWKNRGSEKLIDTDKFSPSGEESAFEHGPPYSHPVPLPPQHMASLLPAEMRGAKLAVFSVQGSRSWGVCVVGGSGGGTVSAALGFPPEL